MNKVARFNAYRTQNPLLVELLLDIWLKNGCYCHCDLTEIAPMIYPYRLIQVAFSRLCLSLDSMFFE